MRGNQFLHKSAMDNNKGPKTIRLSRKEEKDLQTEKHFFKFFVVFLEFFILHTMVYFMFLLLIPDQGAKNIKI